MGTRSRIAVKNDDDTYSSIYCHWDGYPSHHGPILLEAYNSQQGARDLIALGDLSSLGRKLGRKHDFDAAPDDTCNAYGRDRGEKGVDSVVSKTLAELKALSQETGGEHLYLFADGQWLTGGGAFSAFGLPANKEVDGLRPLFEALEEEKRDAA